MGTDANDVRNWIIANYPGTTEVDANGLTVINGIAGQDPNVPFRFTLQPMVRTLKQLMVGKLHGSMISLTLVLAS